MLYNFDRCHGSDSTGAPPSLPHSRQWGYYLSGVLGLVLVLLVIMALSGRL
jgi:Protein of unknown function (DUF3309)